MLLSKNTHKKEMIIKMNIKETIKSTIRKTINTTIDHMKEMKETIDDMMNETIDTIINEMINVIINKITEKMINEMTEEMILINHIETITNKRRVINMLVKTINMKKEVKIKTQVNLIVPNINKSTKTRDNTDDIV